MITKAQLKKHFTSDPHDSDEVNGVKFDVHYLKEGMEAWCNDKYRFDVVFNYDDSKQEIVDDDEDRSLEVSKGATFKFYKLSRKEVK